MTMADETRRRLERGLHDGVQQRLVHTVITLKLARQTIGNGDGPAVDESPDVTGERFPPALEATTYFIVAESLTNVAKHARAGHPEVTASVVGGALHVESRQGGGTVVSATLPIPDS
jgi:signal transduction histidine kinase